jgi:hypothetical protein
MTKSLIALMLAGLLVSGCATRLNPFNWFGNSRAVELPEGQVNPLLPARSRSAFARPEEVYAGVPIDTVETLNIERTVSGAIVHATGIAARQGAYAAQLTPADPDQIVDENGVMTFTFDVIYPRAATPVGGPQTRRVEVARTLSTDVLEQVRTIQVIAARNARESRR